MKQPFLQSGEPTRLFIGGLLNSLQKQKENRHVKRSLSQHAKTFEAPIAFAVRSL
jgi:hypothetical protein